MRSTLVTKVKLDGAEVPLGTWPQKLLRELLVAFIRSLKLKGVDVDSIERITVEIDLKAMEERSVG